MPNLNSTIPVTVAYKKSRGNKVYISVFNNIRVDDILDGNKRKPIIPDDYKILDVGLGDFVERYKKKYKS
jgi:hypothetical protein